MSFSATDSLIGCVKWFNNKAGYGFITLTDGDKSGTDFFVHHSAINVNNQYKYLVQGEYVEFKVVDSTSAEHKCQVSSVNGIKGGQLMCETINSSKTSRTDYNASKVKPVQTEKVNRNLGVKKQ